MNDKTYKSYKEYNLNIEDATFNFFTDNGAIANSTKVDMAFHSHEFCELFYVTKGEIEIKTNNNIYQLRENDAALIPGHIAHQSKGTDDSQRIVISFICTKNKSPGNYYGGFNSLMQNTVIVFNNFAGADACRRFARYYYGNFSEKYHLILSCLYEIITLTKEFAAKDDNTGDILIADSILYRNYLIEDYLKTRFSDGSLSELSGLLHLSSQQTRRIIKNIHKKTFCECITESKMKNAAKLITDTDLSFADISAKVGYKCVHGFFAAFKKYYNVTPGEFRKNKTN